MQLAKSREGVRKVVVALRLFRKYADSFVTTRIVTAVILIVITSILSALAPAALKVVVDELTNVSGNAAVIVPYGFVAIYVLAQWLGRVIWETRGLVYTQAEARAFRNLSEEVFAHVMNLPLRFHIERQTGALIQVVSGGVTSFQIMLQQLLFSVLPVLVELGTMLIVLLGLRHSEFMWLFAGALLGYSVLFRYTAAVVSHRASRVQTAHINTYTTLTDSILNYEAVKHFAAELLVRKRVRAKLIDAETETIAASRRTAIVGLGTATIFATLITLTFVHATRSVANGQMTIGEFMLITAYMAQVIRPVEALAYAVQALASNAVVVSRLLDLLAQPAERDCASSQGALVQKGTVEFQSVSFSYTPDRKVLNTACFKVRPGQTLAIVGASGSGKSTVVRLLIRLLEPDSGRVLLNQVAVSDIPLPQLRRSIAIVPQDTVLFDDSIANNIRFGKPECTEAEIIEAAKLAHLHHFIMSLPEGYETRVGERGVKLSGGERQRVSIARAVIKSPAIFVFDEATSSLDSKTEQEILGNLQEISDGATTVVIAHRLSTVTHADEIVVLDNGSIAEVGSHDSLLRRKGVYAALWEAQQRIVSDTSAKRDVTARARARRANVSPPP